MGKKKLFCDINPTCYAISTQKEVLRRHLRDHKRNVPFARTLEKTPLPNLVSHTDNRLIKVGPGIDTVLQENKAVNIALACGTMNGLLIRPGEVFSFWTLIGKPSKSRGYRDGRVIIANQIRPGTGGGLCNLGNTIHWLLLHSPLEVVEWHSHSDALAPDEGPREPFHSGTSVSYNYIDFRFRNNSDQTVQLLVWCEDGQLWGELRSERPFAHRCDLEEEGHHFQKEGETYFRVSKIYRRTFDQNTGELVEKKLVWDNHSEVMFDYSLIPKEQIWE